MVGFSLTGRIGGFGTSGKTTMTGIMRVWCPTECDFLVQLLPENWNSELNSVM